MLSSHQDVVFHVNNNSNTINYYAIAMPIGYCFQSSISNHVTSLEKLRGLKKKNQRSLASSVKLVFLQG